MNSSETRSSHPSSASAVALVAEELCTNCKSDNILKIDSMEVQEEVDNFQFQESCYSGEEGGKNRNLMKAAYDLEDNCAELINGFFEQRKAVIRLQVRASVVEAEAEDVMFDLEDIRRKLMEQEHKVVNLGNRVKKRLTAKL